MNNQIIEKRNIQTLVKK